jgi:hypothetical protein
VSHEPTTDVPRTDGREETLGGEAEEGPRGRLRAAGEPAVVVPAEVVVVGAGLVVVVSVDGEVVVTAAVLVVVAVVAGGGSDGLVDTPTEVVSGPLPAHGLPPGIA